MMTMRDLFAVAMATVLGAAIGITIAIGVTSALAPPLYAAPPHPIVLPARVVT